MSNLTLRQTMKALGWVVDLSRRGGWGWTAHGADGGEKHYRHAWTEEDAWRDAEKAFALKLARARDIVEASAPADTDCISLLADLDAGKPVGAEAAAVIRQFIKDREAPAPEGGAVTMIRSLLDHIDRETCHHDNLKRGGVQWTICEDCDRKWADDQGGFKPHVDAPPVAAARLYLAALAAREVAPAEWFGVTGAVDETEALAVALFAVRCPGVRMTDEDLHHYRSAAKRAMQVVSAELSGNPGQLDAPAEAGEDGLLRRLDGIARGDIFSDEFVSIHTTCREAAERIRAQPPAREDAQPVAWAIFWRHAMTLHSTLEAAETARKGVPHDIVPLYTHPAPDALRLAVEALEKIKAVRVCKESANIWTGADACRKIATEALAALQAEQKGGA